MQNIKVIIDPSSGAHYDCATMEEANQVFENAPAPNEGSRFITVDGVIVREEYITD